MLKLIKIRSTWVPVLLGGVVGLLGAIGLLAGVFSSSSDRVSDRFFLDREADPSIVIVAVDDASLAKVGRWPWPRETHADLIQRLTVGGAQVIGYDVNFPEPSSADQDGALVDAIRVSGKVVLPIELALSVADGEWKFEPAKTVQSITAIQSVGRASGFTNLPLDVDGIARRLPVQAQSPDRSLISSFAYELARLAGRAPAREQVPLDRNGVMRVHYPASPTKAFRTISAADVFQISSEALAVKNAIVLVGATARDLHDEQLVPTSHGMPMSGVEIHASILDTLMSRQWLRPVPWWTQSLFLVLLGAFLGMLFSWIRRRKRVLVIGLLPWIVWLVVAFIFFDRGWILDVIWPTIVLIFAFAILLFERWIATERERRAIRQTFGRYLSPIVVDKILQNPEQVLSGGERRRMSVLFSDLRGFTSLSEGLAPEKLVEVLNTYLESMTRIVFDERGVLDKYIGDAMMAFWNAPFDQPDHAARAVRAAIRMRDRLESMNREGMFPPEVELKVGVGVNTGDMVVGNIGSDIRYDYTVIGDSVNLASRAEGLCKEYGVPIIVTHSTREELGDGFVCRLLDQVAVKGKREPIRIYEVMGEASHTKESTKHFAQQCNAVVERYFKQDFAFVIEEVQRLLPSHPDDQPLKILLERSRAYLLVPPPTDWTGVWVMTKK
ncbi:CHASE2 domain-containing protein [Candidatus Uhrbacteria bacterium]|nr:CHASE2 domain-containing protein [Candidatus Uhrbacteria bacterium]